MNKRFCIFFQEFLTRKRIHKKDEMNKGCLQKKSPYGGTLFQLGGEGVKKNLLKIPFY